MTDKDYVSFDVAKLLQDKGFRDECHAVYEKVYKDKDIFKLTRCFALWDFDYLTISKSGEQLEYLAPTLYEAQNWLIYEHDIRVLPTFVHQDDIPLGYNCDIYNWCDLTKLDRLCHNYEEALNAGIKESLKLI